MRPPLTLPMLLITALVAVPLHPSTWAADEVVIPSDFKLTAEYASPDYSWATTITAEGDVSQVWRSPEVFEATGKDEARKQLKLTRKDLETLVSKAKKADLFSLPLEISKGGEDSAWYRLSVTMSRKTHETYSAGPSRTERQENRFYLVYSEVLRHVASPFPGQEAKRYDPAAR